MRPAGNKGLLLEFKIKQEKCRSVVVFIHTHFGSFAGDFGMLMELLYGIREKINDCLQIPEHECQRYRELQIN
jgi:hypothetical protein